MMENGGRMHGFQIWVNLPKAHKLIQPHYQEYASEQLPIVTGPGSWIRVIAGEVDGRRSPIETLVPTTMVHLKLEPGASVAVPLAPGSNAIVHTIDGAGFVEETALADHRAALIAHAPTTLHLAPATSASRRWSGRYPAHEPVARYGPFVMNTRAELEQAFRDFQAGRFGEIARLN